MISNTLKVNAIILFAVALTASGGALIKQKTKIVDSYTKLKSNPLLSNIATYSGLKFHPHSEHYIYKEETVEETDKPAFKALALKLSKLPSNFPSKIILTTVSAPAIVASTALNTGNPLTDHELYLISKYWLQLLPHFNSELLKCLAAPFSKPSSSTGKDQFPSNCPSEIRYLKQNTTASSSTIKIKNPSFNIPQTLYSKLYKCPSLKCKGNSECYCTNKSCSNENSCKRFDISELTIGPRFFHATSSIPSNFHYPTQPQSPQKLLQTFNSTGTLTFTNPKKLPHFSFPLPHSSHTPSQTQNSIATSETASLSISPHWPQKIEIKTNFIVELNGTQSDKGETSLNALVSQLLDSPSSFETSSTNTKLQAHSPTQLFFVRYLATVYSLLWKYYPNSLPLFLDKDRSLLFESPTFNSNEPLFNIHPQTQSTQK